MKEKTKEKKVNKKETVTSHVNFDTHIILYQDNFIHLIKWKGKGNRSFI